MTDAIAPQQQRLPASVAEWSVNDLVSQVRKIQEAKAAVMRLDEHYGVIPGTPKPTLYKAGAEKLCLLFRLAPRFEAREARDGNHLTVTTTCILTHIPTGQVVGSGVGCCSTKESKYAYRESKRVCPKCKKDTIIKGKAEYGGGWICFARKGGCGAKWPDGAKEIEDQNVGRVDNPDLPDAWNTVTKMSNKRALVAAVLVATGGSDIFTQDLEDLPEVEREIPATKPPPKQQPKHDLPREESYIDVEAQPVNMEPGEPPTPPPEDDGMPTELRRILRLIDAAPSIKDLMGLGAEIAGMTLEPSLLADARKAYAARLDDLRKRQA